MQNYRVSVITPTYNRPDKIRETIKSFLAQDYDNCEMIIVNDGSTKSYSNVNDLLQSDKIRMITKENGGTASALNAGIMASTGELLCEIQDDDLLRGVDSISSRVRVLQDTEKYGVEVIWTSAENIQENGNTYGIIRAEPANAWRIWGHDYINTNTLMWRKSIHEKIGYFDEEMLAGEDQPFEIKLLMECSCLAVPDLVTVKYRVWRGSKGIPERTNGMKEKYTLLMYKKMIARYNLMQWL